MCNTIKKCKLKFNIKLLFNIAMVSAQVYLAEKAHLENCLLVQCACFCLDEAPCQSHYRHSPMLIHAHFTPLHLNLFYLIYFHSFLSLKRKSFFFCLFFKKSSLC